MGNSDTLYEIFPGTQLFVRAVCISSIFVPWVRWLCFFGTFFSTYKTARRHDPEDHSPNFRRRGNVSHGVIEFVFVNCVRYLARTGTRPLYHFCPALETLLPLSVPPFHMQFRLHNAHPFCLKYPPASPSKDSFSTTIIIRDPPGFCFSPPPRPPRYTTSPDRNYFHSGLGSYFTVSVFFSDAAALRKNNYFLPSRNDCISAHRINVAVILSVHSEHF
jgi:hypothetical protein